MSVTRTSQLPTSHESRPVYLKENNGSPGAQIGFEVNQFAARTNVKLSTNSVGLGFNLTIPTHFVMNLNSGNGRVYELDCRD